MTSASSMHQLVLIGGNTSAAFWNFTRMIAKEQLLFFFPPQTQYFWGKTVKRVSSVQYSCSVVSDSLRPHELQHDRPPCPSPTPGVHSDSCSLSRWCHPASHPLVPFSSCPQSLPASESFPMSQLFAWGSQIIFLVNRLCSLRGKINCVWL